MDFVKKAAISQMTGGGESHHESKDSKESSSSSSSGSHGKYDQYISKGVDYAEEKFMHTDIKNKSDSVRSRDEKITVSISSSPCSNVTNQFSLELHL
ncbi:hypothetical protein TRICI_003447 [Trichomonascus ciferrii]|uniref:Uncharacterized protein n=1 Tax=Trichomonascus ciferrii TaxID=44093 RepID=A0A642V3Z7_9ASCO|nr:hypothetical protein TRICI_003447 [Trichomonascus ciferrii]